MKKFYNKKYVEVFAYLHSYQAAILLQKKSKKVSQQQDVILQKLMKL